MKILVVLLMLLTMALFQPSTSLPRLLFANRRDIRILRSTNGISNETIVFSGLEDAICLDFDYQQKIVFWTDVSSEKIQSARLFGSKTEVRNVFNFGLKRPVGLAVDWATKKFYWTEVGTKPRIEVANFDGSLRKVLFWRNLDQPRAIAVDPLSGYMFWTDWGNVPKIERADMDGNNRKVIVYKSIYWPNGLTIDYKDETIYWVDAKLHNIACTDFNGDRRRTVVRGILQHPFALSLFGNKLYWTDWTTRSIHTCNKKNGSQFNVLKSKIETPMDIKVFEPGRQKKLPSSRNQCGRNNGGCSHLCLLCPQGYSCACPTGVRLLSNRKSCERPEPLHFLLLARRSDIRRISLDTPDYTDVVLPLTGIKQSTAIDFDPVQKYVYWSDDNNNHIKRARTDGTGVEVVASIEVQNPDGLAVDWIARNLYWTDTGMDRIEVSRLDGSSRAVLISEGLREPRAIVVDPGKGYMFWTDWGKHAKIERAYLDGNSRMVLVQTSIIWPNGLAIDYADQRLYWADAKLDKIEVMDYNGENRQVLVNEDLTHVFGLTVLGEHLYWTDWQKRNVEMMDKSTGKGRKILIKERRDLMGLKAINMSITYGWNACSMNNGNCSHLCLARPGQQRTCSCPMHFNLLPDNKTCEAPKAFMLYSTTQSIRRSLFNDYHNISLPLRKLNNVIAISYDIITQYVYWIDGKTNTIRRAFENGSGDSKVISDPNIAPHDLAIDPYGQQMYWTDSVRDNINVFSLRKMKSLGVVGKGKKPRSIALLPEKGLMFWTDLGSNRPKILRAKMDGTKQKVIVRSRLESPQDLAVDGKKLYWTDTARNAKTIEVCNLSGSKRVVLVKKNLSKPVRIAVYDQFLYWIDKYAREMIRVRKDNGSQMKTIQAGIGLTDLVAVDRRKKIVNHPCTNTLCQHICLIGRKNTAKCSGRKTTA